MAGGDGDAGERSGTWWVGGRVFWIGLALSCFMLRASELFAKSKAVYHNVYCLRMGHVVFVRGNEKLAENRTHEAHKVEVGYRGPNGNHGRGGWSW